MADIWHPYHQRLQDTLSDIKARHGYALLFDAHSIASRIPRLFEGTLPSLNIGTNQGASCAPSLEEAVLNCCLAQPFSYVFNGRFKGGYITRAYGQPHAQQNAVQLELAQCNYYGENRALQLCPDARRTVATDAARDALGHRRLRGGQHG